MVELIVFAVGSAGIIWLSWSSFRDWRSHGFFRFFAFECVLALALLNASVWFRNPFSLLQIISWLLLLASLFLVVHGFYMLRRMGRPEGRIEDTTRLVTTGAYRYIRHPLYSSLFLGNWGAFLKDPSLAGIALALAASAFLIATARVEEGENLERFGDEYARYMQQTKMFIPGLF